MNIPRDIILQGDALEQLRTLPDGSVQCCITSPPYFGLRDYGMAGQIGLEETPSLYIDALVQVFREVRRVLCYDGVLWLNLGDSYAATNGHTNKVCGNPTFNESRPSRELTSIPVKGIPSGFKPKDLMMIPARLAIALQEDGYYLRSDIIWHKLTAMPESVTDRPTSAHEHVFLLAKSERYYYDADAIREPLKPKTYTTFGTKHHAQGNDALGLVKSDNWGRTVTERQPRLAADGEIAGANKRNVWPLASQPYSEAHFATFPPKLIEPMILAGSRPGDVILDPFMGAGTTAMVALQQGRHFIGIELNADYIALAHERIATVQPTLWTSSEKMEEVAS